VRNLIARFEIPDNRLLLAPVDPLQPITDCKEQYNKQ
jgi:hypothetical protein